MRMFFDAVEMIKEVERDLFEMGTRYQSLTVQDKDVSRDERYKTIELIGYAYTLMDLDEESVFDAAMYTDYVPADWLRCEARERTQGLPPGIALNPGTAWLKNRKFWNQYIRNGVFSYSYAERWQAQIPYVINELTDKPNTRQAVITMYDRHEDMLKWGGIDRVPCSLTYQFIRREDRLVLIYNQRSCDFIKFFGADVYFSVALLKYVAKLVNLPPGEFIHFMGSLHAFAGDLDKRDIF